MHTHPGITATLVCFPLDVLRTRLMTPWGRKYGGPFTTLACVARHEGLGALYAGCLPAVVGMVRLLHLRQRRVCQAGHHLSQASLAFPTTDHLTDTCAHQRMHAHLPVCTSWSCLLGRTAQAAHLGFKHSGSRVRV